MNIDIVESLESEINTVNNRLAGFTPIVDTSTGEITGYRTTVGADTVFPFKKEATILNLGSYTIGQGTSNFDISGVYIDYENLNVDNFFVRISNIRELDHSAREWGTNTYSYLYNPSTGIYTVNMTFHHTNNTINYNIIATVYLYVVL